MQFAGNAQIGVHGALCVRRYHHQTLTGYAGITIVAKVGIDTGCFHICYIEITGFVVGDVAGIEGFRTEVARANNRVGCAATACAFFQTVAFCQGGQHGRQLILFDQGHHAFFYACIFKESVVNFEFFIDQCIADAVNVIAHSGSVVYIIAVSVTESGRSIR